MTGPAPKPDLLFLSHRIPYPPDKGEKIRGWHLVSHLARDRRVHLGCLVDDPADRVQVEHLARVCASVGAFPIDRRRQTLRALLRARPGRALTPDFYASRELRAWVGRTVAAHPIDTVYICTVAMAPYALGLRGPRLILDAIDVDSEKWTERATRARFPARLVWAREGRNLLAYERRAASACERTLFVSEPEAMRFVARAPELASRVTSVENGVDLHRFSPSNGFPRPYADGPCVVFTGHMDYWPNQDAAHWFASGILPVLQARRPDLQFWIVGANPDDAVRALARRPGVHVTGRVADVRPYVAHADAVVVPLRTARGIQNKVLEAMAMGRPVIATGAAFEGVRAEAGRDLLVADDVSGFAASVERVLDGGVPGLGSAARAAMERSYAWGSVLARLDRLLASDPD